MIEPHSLQLGASCWKRIGGAVFLAFTASASFAGRTKPMPEPGTFVDAATVSMNATSFGVGFPTLDAGRAAGIVTTSIVSRLITPASSWLSRFGNLIASHLK